MNDEGRCRPGRSGSLQFFSSQRLCRRNPLIQILQVRLVLFFLPWKTKQAARIREVPRRCVFPLTYRSPFLLIYKQLVPQPKRIAHTLPSSPHMTFCHLCHRLPRNFSPPHLPSVTRHFGPPCSVFAFPPKEAGCFPKVLVLTRWSLHRSVCPSRGRRLTLSSHPFSPPETIPFFCSFSFNQSARSNRESPLTSVLICCPRLFPLLACPMAFFFTPHQSS